MNLRAVTVSHHWKLHSGFP